MEYTQEELSTIKESKISKEINNQIAKHRWLTMIVMIVITLSIINGIMIYNFFKILQTL